MPGFDQIFTEKEGGFEERPPVRVSKYESGMALLMGRESIVHLVREMLPMMYATEELIRDQLKPTGNA
jgi:hypothetical protein